MNSYIKTLRNKKNQQKSKTYNNIFKWVLMAITIIVVFFILVSFISIIAKGAVTGTTTSSTNWTEILFGSTFHMSDQFAMGIIIFNTVWMSFLVLLIATPVSVATALFITRVLPKTPSMIMVAIVSILAAIPSVVYGSFGKYFLVGFLHNIGFISESQDATLIVDVIVVAIMVMPTITLMSTTSILLVDNKVTDSSMALGATKTQTSVYIVLRSAKTGIIIGMLFALGRCLGEATALSMMTSKTDAGPGATFGLFQVSLFMSPVIMNAFTMQGTFPAYTVVYEVLSALLLIVILILFSAVKYIELLTDDKENSKKQSKKSIAIYNAKKKLDIGEEELTPEEGRLIGKDREKIYYQNYQLTKTDYVRSSEISATKSKTSLDGWEKQTKFKKSRTLRYTILISALSLLGVLSLVMILGFLFDTDLSLLFNWNYWTLKGREEVNGAEYWGLAIPLFGTLFSVVLSLAIAMPLGIAIATYVDSYLQRGSNLSKVVGFAFQIMTSIPAVIYGALAVIIFAKTNWINENFVSFKPIFMLSLVILPTIIKQTTEGFNNVKISQQEGSLALGATKAYTSRRIILSQSIPAILAAAILATSIVMADSAIFITILLVKPNTWSTPDLWIANGGYTLSTNIYWVSRILSSDPLQRATALQQIKVTGIILMIFIFWLSIISQKIKNKNKIDSALMSAGILLFTISPFIIDGGIFALFILSIIMGILGLFADSLWKRVRK